MNPFYLSPSRPACFANDNSAFFPTLWAREGLRILEEQMVMAALVVRDFENEVAHFGQTVNTRRPANFYVSRNDDVNAPVVQNAASTNVSVTLNQRFSTSFVIKDGEETLSFQELIDTYIVPGMMTQARGVDRALLGLIPQFLGTPSQRAGGLGTLSETNAKNAVLNAREVLNANKAPMDPRNLVLSTASETAILKDSIFIKAMERGDDGRALTEARLGRILGFNTYLDQNTPSISFGTSDVLTGTVTDALAVGTTGSITVSITGQVKVGEYVDITGNDQPTFVTAVTYSSPTTTAITLSEPIAYATAASAVVTVYSAAAVDNSSGYAAGSTQPIAVDSWTNPPQVGQVVSFGTGGSRATYTILEAQPGPGGSDMSILLSAPLVNSVANNDPVFLGPAGAFNFAFHREAIALVSRPLAMVPSDHGARCAVATHNGVAMRVTMQYQIASQGTQVVLDQICGTAVLNSALGCVLLG